MTWLKKIRCWWRKQLLKMRSPWIVWDGHCWSGKPEDGATADHVVCIDCGTTEFVGVSYGGTDA